VTTPEIIDQIHELILEDCRISAKSIAEQMGILRERVGPIFHEDLNMRKLSAKWVPKCLNADQKRQRYQSSEQLLEFFRRDPNDFLSRLVTMNETCMTAMTRRQSNNQWSGGIAAHPASKYSECKNPLEKFSPRFIGIKTASSIVYLPKGQTINAEYCLSLLVQLKDILKEKRRGKVTQGVLFLHDIAPAVRALATQKKLAYLGFQCLDHLAYSLDLAPSDYHQFPGLKKRLKGRHFSFDADVIAAAETW